MQILAAGAIVLDNAGRLLLIRRLRAPDAGDWSVPGGKCEAGEPAAAACLRELTEETGLVAEIMRPAGRVQRDCGDGGQFVIDDFVCRVVGGRLRAGDDAAAAGWFDRQDLDRLPLVDGLLTALTEWRLLPV